ncbi:MAG: AarF/UbiB family protein [Candidatus Obscuribacter sp.]|nr:AarF/UbiB family protein [Candidatus Obscuribacter sp.]
MRSTTSFGVNLFNRTRRVLQILLLVSRFFQKTAALRLDSSLNPEAKERDLARWAKAEFVKLGPTFIKLGQIISTRPDLFPRVWVDEFTTLQDRVSPFGFDLVKEVIEDELGRPAEELFLTIEEEPLAVASIGQIHRVTRKIGTEIRQEVIKVQRPGVEELVNLDLSVLRSIVQHLIFLPRFTKEADLYGFLDELVKTFSAELDYRVEAANTEEFRKMFEDPALAVIIPAVDYERSARRVLTLEFLPGTKLSKFTGTEEEIKETARILIAAFLKQFALEGTFHADPHPGNIAVRKNDSGKVEVILYDFGMIGRLSPAMRDSILRIAGAAFKGDTRTLVAECAGAGLLNPSTMNDPDILSVFENFIAKLDKVSAETIGILQQQLSKASESGGVTFPGELTLVGRALLSLEGDLRALQAVCPDLKLNRVILTETMPLAEKLLGEPLDPIERVKYDAEKLKRTAASILRKGTRLFEQIERGEFKFPVEDAATASAIRRLRFGAKSVSAAIIFAAFFIPSIYLLEGGKDLLLGLPLFFTSIFFLEKWYLAERRMDG